MCLAFSSAMYCNEYLFRDKIHELKMRVFSVPVLAAYSSSEITRLFVSLALVAAEMLMMSQQGQVMNISRKNQGTLIPCFHALANSHFKQTYAQ